ncbi:MAG: hypothetical protein BJ554DRAFT_6705, partial [Olpidium bornovanus]
MEDLSDFSSWPVTFVTSLGGHPPVDLIPRVAEWRLSGGRSPRIWRVVGGTS